MRILRAIDKVLTSVVRAAIFVLLSGMLLIAILQVLTRYVFSFSFTWSEELLRLTMLWSAFLAASLGVRESKHIGLDLVLNLLPDSTRERIRVVMRFVILLLLGVFCFLTAKMTLFMADMVSPILQISKSIWYLSLLLGFVFMIFYYIYNIAEAVHNIKKG